ncbi:hypothetical protein [Bartonella pachyuromydis]
MSRLHAFDSVKLSINANRFLILYLPIRGAHDIIETGTYAQKKQLQL